MNNNLHSARKINLLGYLSADKRSWKTRSPEEQIMSKDKFSSNFWCQMEAIVVIILQIFLEHEWFENWGITLRYSPVKAE